jgi:hypothetical protein
LKLDADKILKESRSFNGALGMVSFVVAKALRHAGAGESEIGQVVGALKKRIPSLSDEDCNTLCSVLYTRMTEEKERHAGRWYPG